MIKLLSVAIFAGLFFASQTTSELTTVLPEVETLPPSFTTVLPEVETLPPSFTTVLREAKECWTKWFDRDDPSGSGDWETLSSLRRENPGQICPKPAAIEAQTLTGVSAAAAGEVIYKSDTTAGFACRNRDQRNKKCKDYRVRFGCPRSYCGIKVCWTKWFDRDDPSGSGDWETLSSLRRENPGQICPKPGAIEAQTLTGVSAAAAGEVIYKSDTTTGFVCRNKDQKGGRRCRDYKVKFGCPCKNH